MHLTYSSSTYYPRQNILSRPFEVSIMSEKRTIESIHSLKITENISLDTFWILLKKLIIFSRCCLLIEKSLSSEWKLEVTEDLRFCSNSLKADMLREALLSKRSILELPRSTTNVSMDSELFDKKLTFLLDYAKVLC